MTKKIATTTLKSSFWVKYLPTNKFGRDRDLYVIKRALRIIRKETSDLGLIHTNGDIDAKHRSRLAISVHYLQKSNANLNKIIEAIAEAKKKKEWW